MGLSQSVFIFLNFHITSSLLSLLCIELMFLMFCEIGASGLPAYLTVLFTVVFGVMLVFNSLGCYFGARWKKRRGQTGNHNDLFVYGCQSVSSITSCHYNVPIPQQNSTVTTPNHDAIVRPSLSSHLSMPLFLSFLSPLLLLIL